MGISISPSFISPAYFLGQLPGSCALNKYSFSHCMLLEKANQSHRGLFPHTHSALKIHREEQRLPFSRPLKHQGWEPQLPEASSCCSWLHCLQLWPKPVSTGNGLCRGSAKKPRVSRGGAAPGKYGPPCSGVWVIPAPHAHAFLVRLPAPATPKKEELGS